MEHKWIENAIYIPKPLHVDNRQTLLENVTRSQYQETEDEYKWIDNKIYIEFPKRLSFDVMLTELEIETMSIWTEISQMDYLAVSPVREGTTEKHLQVSNIKASPFVEELCNLFDNIYGMGNLQSCGYNGHEHDELAWICNKMNGSERFVIDKTTEEEAARRMVLLFLLELIDMFETVNMIDDWLRDVDVIVNERYSNLKHHESSKQYTEGVLKGGMSILFNWSCKTITLQIFTIILLLNSCQGNKNNENRNVEVNLMSHPMVFLDNVTLDCIIRSNTMPTYLAWTKIPSGETIAFINSTYPSTKYVASVDHQKHITVDHQKHIIVYKLVIHHFNISDLNIKYFCDSDFDSSYTILEPNSADFVAVPEKSEVQENQKLIFKNGVLTGEFTFPNFFPQPNCTAMFENTDITQQLQVSSYNSSLFYRTNVKLKMKTQKCMGSVKISCSVKNRDCVKSSDFNYCGENKSILTSNWWLLSVVFVLVVCLLFIMVLIILCFRIQLCRPKSREDTEGLNEFIFKCDYLMTCFKKKNDPRNIYQLANTNQEELRVETGIKTENRKVSSTLT